MRRTTTFVGLGLVSALALASCSPPESGDEQGGAELLKVAIDSEPATFDWHQSTAGATQLAAVQVLETLYSLDENYVATPQLAASEPVVSDDNLTYTIPLRDDVVFHDGSTMDAHDVVASLKRWGEVSSNGKPLFERVDSVEATSDFEVTLTLNSPYDVVRTLSVPIAAAAIMPEEIMDDYGQDVIEDVGDIVGTGPYIFTDWQRGQGYDLTMFEDYQPADNGAAGGLAAAKPATYKTIDISIVDEPSTRFQSTATGQYDVGLAIPGDMYNQFTEQDSIDAQLVSPFYSQYMLLNTSKPPFDDPDVRKAFAIALDQESLADAAYGSSDLYTLNGAIYPEDMGALSSSAGIQDYGEADVDAAQELLENSSYDGETLTLMTSQALSQVYNFSIAAEQQLEQAGFSVELDVTEWATMNGRYTQPETWDMFSTAFGIGYTLPSSHLLLNGHFPYEGWYAQDDEMAGLLEDWHTADEDEQRDALMDEVHVQFYEDMPAVKLADYSLLNAVSTDVSLDEVTFYWPTWWDVVPR